MGLSIVSNNSTEKHVFRHLNCAVLENIIFKVSKMQRNDEYLRVYLVEIISHFFLTEYLRLRDGTDDIEATRCP